MNPRKKEINSVKPSDWCAESFPCQHDVTIKYKDGTEKTKSDYSGLKLFEKYGKFLSKADAEHFSMYANMSFKRK